jgi:hypothetical protein
MDVRCTAWDCMPYGSSGSPDTGSDRFKKIKNSRIGSKRAIRICVPFYTNNKKRKKPRLTYRPFEYLVPR